jgi:cytochrome c
MFDTMTMTKTLGALCGALLIFLLGKWGADAMYGFYGHDKHHAASYVIDTGADEAGDMEEVIEIAFADVYAVADAGSGERLWRQCAACHKLEAGANGTGPHLFNVVNRDKGAIDGFGYSGTLADMDGNWDYEALNAFLANPKGYVKGTKMTFSGLKKDKDRANIIAYLETIQ